MAAFLKCGDLQEGFARGRVSGTARVRDAAAARRLAGRGLRAVPGCDHEYMAPEIELEVVENMRTWGHSGFSRPSLRDGARQSVFLPAGDQAGIERLIQYMTRCPFSLSRLVKDFPGFGAFFPFPG